MDGKKYKFDHLICVCEIFSLVAATRSIAALGMLCAVAAAAVGSFLSAFDSVTFY